MVYKATSGNSGLPGLVMESIEHDKELVDIVRQRAPKKRGRDINVVCPMAGKTFAFNKWKESLGKLPMDRAHVLVYDNSNRPAFHRMIEEFCQREFDSYTLVQDDNQKLTIDGLPNSSLGWKAIASRCDDVYGEIYGRWMDPRRPLCLNLEDDIGIPQDSWDRLSHTIRDEQVATVIGQCNDRRLFVHNGQTQSIAVNFKIQEKLGAENVREVETIPATPKDFGVEAVGGGHMGLWLTKTEAIQEVGIATRTDYIHGTDINWGYQLNRAGWKFAIDWSLKMDHFFQDSRGKLQSC